MDLKEETSKLEALFQDFWKRVEEEYHEKLLKKKRY